MRHEGVVASHILTVLAAKFKLRKALVQPTLGRSEPMNAQGRV